MISSPLLNNPQTLNSLYAQMQLLVDEPDNGSLKQAIYDIYRPLQEELRRAFPVRTFYTIDRIADGGVTRQGVTLQYKKEKGGRCLKMYHGLGVEFSQSRQGVTHGIGAIFVSNPDCSAMDAAISVYCRIKSDSSLLDDLAGRFGLTVGHSIGSLARTIYNCTIATGSPYEGHEESFTHVGEEGFRALTFAPGKHSFSSSFECTPDLGLSMTFCQLPLPPVIRRRLWEGLLSNPFIA